MKFFLVGPTRNAEYDPLWEDYQIVQRSAEENPGEHSLVSEPGDAEVILFVGSRMPLHEDVRRDSVARRFPAKVHVYDCSDWLIPFYPGVYPSIQSRYYDPSRIRSGFYLRYSNHTHITASPVVKPAKYLYSFTGAMTHPIRVKILALEDDRALLRDTTREAGRDYGQTPEIYERYKQAYAATLGMSQFVICPRGVSPASIRLFETMKAGRVPVVISDEWVPPLGPKWSEFSLRVAEREVESIPELLRGREGEVTEMGALARVSWERWFSPAASFRTLAAWCAELASTPRPETWLRRAAYLQLLRPHFFRHSVVSPAVRAIHRKLLAL